MAKSPEPPAPPPARAKAKPKAKRARKPNIRREITAAMRRQVQLMCGMGLAQRAIALLMDVTVPTLRRHYKTELARGEALANFQVSHSMFKSATRAEKPNVEAQKFWLKCRAGWGGAADSPLGKKQQAEIAALTAAEGTEWSGLFN